MDEHQHQHLRKSTNTSEGSRYNTRSLLRTFGIFVWMRQASFAKQERPNQASRACRQSEPPRLKHSSRPAILASRTTSDTVGSYIDASDMYHTCNLCLRTREAHGKSA
jgi:hypothetical protein